MNRRLWCCLVLVYFCVLTGAVTIDRWIENTRLPPLDVEYSTQIIDRQGLLLRAYTVADGRWRLPPGHVDPQYITMLLAFEDQRFWSHHGIDLRAMTRAAWQSLRAGRIVSGASTLTMQVARLIETQPKGRWAAKWRQIRVALALERQMSKSEILRLYLSLAPYGGNIEGIRAASLIWFGKEPHRLSAHEAALMVALPQSPSRRSPDRFATAARLARDRVLARAFEAGAIDRETQSDAMLQDVPDKRQPMPQLAPHLTDRLRRASPYQLQIETLLDANVQARLELLARSSLVAADKKMQVALMAAEHRTGAIVASVGAAYYTNDTRQSFVDMTQAWRSPGSTLKPLIYGLAFDAGVGHPNTIIQDRPVRFNNYAPQNFDGEFHGALTMAEALRRSRNVPVIKILARIGPEALLAGLRRAGLTLHLPKGRSGLAIGLGGGGLRLHDLVQLYGSIARGGQAVSLSALPKTSLSKVTRATEPARILSAEAAWHLSEILAASGAPQGARAGLAYKTGTSYGHRDAWAIGWDGKHVIGVWMGRADGTPVPGAFGADLAAPVLFAAFERLGARTALPRKQVAAAQALTPLPARLRHFEIAQGPVDDGPKIAFPPAGAALPASDALLLKVHNGIPPFTWLANGRVLTATTRARELWVPAPAPGFVTLSVIDADGAASRHQIEIMTQ